MTLSLPELGQKCRQDVVCVALCFESVVGGGEEKKAIILADSLSLLSSSLSLSPSLPFLCCFQDGGSHVRSPGLRASVACQRSYLLVD